MVLGGGIMQLADKAAVGQFPNQTKISLYLYNILSHNHVLCLFSYCIATMSEILKRPHLWQAIRSSVWFIQALNRSPFLQKQERKQILMLLSL